MRGKRAGKRRQGRDVREFWPWYERTPSITEFPAEPPPFTLEDIERTRAPRGSRQRSASAVILATLAVLVFLLWRILL